MPALNQEILINPELSHTCKNKRFHHIKLNISTETKVRRSKPPPVLTSGFNRLKPPRSICQKVVNTGQYESEW